jgi:hypothetical protein
MHVSVPVGHWAANSTVEPRLNDHWRRLLVAWQPQARVLSPHIGDFDSVQRERERLGFSIGST